MQEEKSIAELKEENAYLKNYNQMLENANFSMMLKESALENNFEELKGDKIYKTLEKVTEEREIFKETINIMCDKFKIDPEIVISIIDSIELSKENQLERSL